MGGGEEEWRKRADKEASKRPAGHGGAGEVLHQRRALPFSFTTITLAGLLISAATGYVVLYLNKKPEATATDVAKVTVGVAEPEDTRPRK